LNKPKNLDQCSQISRGFVAVLFVSRNVCGVTFCMAVSRKFKRKGKEIVSAVERRKKIGKNFIVI